VIYLRTDTINDSPSKFDLSPEERLASSDSDMCEKFGFIKTMNIYKHVRKFIEIVRKRLKNYRTKRMVVEEIIKTEETFI